ncbi:hypothetical protein J8273_8115 [Carpediemonas membranifera]|uniref:TLDc domain-containing protein n=1 Tax=Carpediemonas membranifera TaxID=201153 RepID=A0A8J6AWJ0_9EUKA|nr:hypothetical protein J8273_8115 [Carpediemonas membranifera]|eukprot:KAG9390078.1 hypothetical protein J8273_8115 [Carpediemonas membranifera]
MNFAPSEIDDCIQDDEDDKRGASHLQYAITIQPGAVRHSALSSHLPTSTSIRRQSTARTPSGDGSPASSSRSEAGAFKRTMSTRVRTRSASDPAMPRCFLLISYKQASRDEPGRRRWSSAFFMAEPTHLLSFYTAMMAASVSSKRFSQQLARPHDYGRRTQQAGQSPRPLSSRQAKLDAMGCATPPSHDSSLLSLIAQVNAADDSDPVDLAQVRLRYQLPLDSPGSARSFEYLSDVSVDSYPSSDEADIGVRVRPSAYVTTEPRTATGAAPARTIVPEEPSPSEILPSTHFQRVLDRAPRVHAITAPVLLYSDNVHGRSLQTLYRHCLHAAASILIVETKAGSVMGAFTTAQWAPRTHRTFFGTGESFVFKSEAGRLTLFPWSGSNNSFQLCLHDCLAVGGGGPGVGAAIFLTDNLEDGESTLCPTFGSPSLCNQLIGRDEDRTRFQVAKVEVWGFGV